MAIIGIPISNRQEIGNSLSAINNAFTELDLRFNDILTTAGGTFVGGVTAAEMAAPYMSAGIIEGYGGFLTGVITDKGGTATRGITATDMSAQHVSAGVILGYGGFLRGLNGYPSAIGQFDFSLTAPHISGVDAVFTRSVTTSAGSFASHLSAQRIYGKFFGDGSGLFNINNAGSSLTVGASAFIPTVALETLVSNYDPLYSSVTVLTRNSGPTGSLPTFLAPSTAVVSVSGTTGTAGLSSKYVKFNNSSLYFDSPGYLPATGGLINKYVKVENANMFNVGTSTVFTLEFWIYVGEYPKTSEGANPAHANQRCAALVDTFSKLQQTSIGAFCIGLRGDGTLILHTINGVYTTSATIPLNKWTHVAFERYSSFLYFNVDGVRTSIVANGTISLTPPANIINVGSSPWIPGIFSGGEYGLIDTAISEFRITVGATRYAAATFTVPAGYFSYKNSNDVAVNTSLLVTDNVGIGTNTPVSKLHVVGSAVQFELGSTGGATFFADGFVRGPALQMSGLSGAYIDLSSTLTGTGTSGSIGDYGLRIANWVDQTNNNTRLSFLNANQTDLALMTNDTTKLIIKNNGNVGIGTSTPGDKLEVNGNIHSKNTTQFSGFAVKNATNTVGYLIGSSVTNDDGSFGLLSGGVDKVSIQANGKSYFNGGNVGIGNNNPGSHLTLGTIGTVPEIALAMQNSFVRMSQRNTNDEFGITTNFTGGGSNDTSKPSWGLFMGAGTGNVDCFNIKRGAAGANSQTTLMWLTSAGRLGIGTTAPTDRLHVPATNGTFATGTKPSGWGGGITTWDLYAGGTIGAGSETGTLSAYINREGNAWLGNSVGIGLGAWSIAYDLQVSKSRPGQLVEVRAENISTANNTAARYTLATSIPNHYALWEVHTNASAPTVNFASGDGTTSGMFFTAGNTVTNHPMVFRQGATERLRIESTGAVTVNNVLRLNAGTDGDSGMLSDAGSLSGVYIKFNAVGQSGSTDWAYLRQIGNRADDFHLALDLHDNENHATAGQSFSIRNVASTQTPDVAETRFIVNGLGNVGIGTSTPAATLGLNGVMLIGNQTNTGSLPDIGSIRVLAASQGNFIQSGQNTSTNSAAPLIFSTINNGTEWMRISEAGNVGIGTNNPSSKLTVAGGSELGFFTGTRDINGYAGIRVSNASATTTPTLQSQTFFDFGNGLVNVSNMHSVMATDGSANLYFSTTPAGSKSVDRRVPRLTITGDGRVGVNTSNPSSYLDVAPPAGTVDEGGEIRLRPAAGYSFDYWMDIWQNNFRLFRSDAGGNNNGSALLQYNPNAGNFSLFDAAVQIAPGGYDDTNWVGANNNPIRYATQVVIGGKIANPPTFSAAAYKYPAIPYSHGHSYIDIVNDNFADYHSRIVRWNAPPGDQYRDVGSPVDGDLNFINTGKGYVYNIIEGGSRVTGSTFVWRHHTQDSAISLFAGAFGVAGFTNATGTASRFNTPRGVTVDPSGNIYVSESGAIRRLTSVGVTTTLAGDGSFGTADGTGAAARFNNARGMVVDSAGTFLYVCDASNHSIRRINLSTAAVTTFAGLNGTSGTTDGTGTAARFNTPTCITRDSSNNLYVADTGNHTIRKITPAGVVTTIAGLAGSTGSTDGTGTAARFNNPRGITIVDYWKWIFVTDAGNHVIRKIDYSGANVQVTTLAGTAGSTGSLDGLGAAARFNNPTGIAYTNDNYLWVADLGNHLIRRVVMWNGLTNTFAGTAGTAGGQDGYMHNALLNGVRDIVYYPGNSTAYFVEETNHTVRTFTVKSKDIAAMTPDGWVLAESGFQTSWTGSNNSPYMIRMAGDQINSAPTATEEATTSLGSAGQLALNASTDQSKFRNTTIYNGKGGIIAGFVGSNGNMGIGTITPGAKLHITGLANTMLLESAEQETVIDFKNTSTNGRQYRIGTGGSAGGLSNGGFGLYDVTAATMRWLVNSNGYMGIGTSNPAERLHVSGSVRVATGNVVIDNDQYLILGANNCKLYRDTFYNGVVLEGGAGELFIGLTSGKVGIGTKNPTYKLDVVGNIRCNEEIIVSPTSNASQARFVQGNYGLIFRQDGSNFYLLPTNSGDQYGQWNTLRPFVVDMATGAVSMNNGLTVNGTNVIDAINSKLSTIPTASTTVLGGVKVDGTTITISNGVISGASTSTPVVSITTSSTLILAHAGAMLTCNSGSPITLTIPTNNSVPFPIGSQVFVEQEGAGTITIAGAAGVDLKSYANRFTTAGQYSVITLIKIATDSWRLGGNLS